MMKAFVPALIAVSVALGACQTGRERLVRAPEPCRERAVQIYFEPESADVTAEGRAVINAAAQGARACQVRSVEVIGLADAVGAPQANLELSRRRAESVSGALAQAGLPAAEFRVAAAGAAGARTADGKAAPLRRRADIILHLAPR